MIWGHVPHHPQSPVLFAAFLAIPLAALAQKKNDQLPERSEAEILKTVTLPEGYEATVFAKPPAGRITSTSVSAAVDGTIFVAIDENGSIGRDRNEPGQAHGKVLRIRDTKDTGHADEFKTFCEVESPRGVIWDGAKGNGPGVLYVMHPPNLTAYYDEHRRWRGLTARGYSHRPRLRSRLSRRGPHDQRLPPGDRRLHLHRCRAIMAASTRAARMAGR